MDNADVTLHCFYTDAVEPMLVRFLSGLRDIRSVDPVKLSRQFVGGGDAKVAGEAVAGSGVAISRFKTELLARLADPASSDPDRIHFVSDIDMAVYGNLVPQIRSLLTRNDLLFQMEGGPTQLSVSLGVIAFRPSAIVRGFWLSALDMIVAQKLSDHDAVNRLIRDTRYIRDSKLRYGFFPSTFWAHSQGEETAPVGRAILHHANRATGMREKWDQLNAYRQRFERDQRNHDAAFALCVGSLSRIPWTYGDMNTQAVFGEIGFQPDGTVTGYGNPHEARLLVGERCLRMHSDAGVCTTVFDEFYFDAFRNTLLCVGAAPRDGIDMRYLLGRLVRPPTETAGDPLHDAAVREQEPADAVLDALAEALTSTSEAARVLYTMAGTFDPGSSLRYFALLDNIKHIGVTVASIEDDVWQGPHLGFRVTFDGLPHITIVLPRFFETAEAARHYVAQRSGSLPHILGRIRLTAFHVCDMILTAADSFIDGVKTRLGALPRSLYFRASWEDTCRDPGIVTYSRDSGAENPLISDVYFYGNDSYRPHKQRLAAGTRPWMSRKDVVFWRGATTGSAFSPDDLERNERIRLAVICARHPELFDVKISNIAQVPQPDIEAVGERLRRLGLFAKGVAMEVFGEYKFSVHIDGNASAASFFEKLTLGCCVLRVPSRFEQWFEPRITPWVHFVPLAADCSDLLDKVTFLIRNPLLAERIAMAGYRFARQADYRHEAQIFCDDLVGSLGRQPVVRYPMVERTTATARLAAPGPDGTVWPEGAECFLPEWHAIQDEEGFPYRWTRAEQVTWRLPNAYPAGTAVKIEIPFVGEIRSGFAAACRLLVAGEFHVAFVLGRTLVAEIEIRPDFDGRVGLVTPPPRPPSELTTGSDRRPLGLSIPVGE